MKPQVSVSWTCSRLSVLPHLFAHSSPKCHPVSCLPVQFKTNWETGIFGRKKTGRKGHLGQEGHMSIKKLEFFSYSGMTSLSEL